AVVSVLLVRLTTATATASTTATATAGTTATATAGTTATATAGTTATLSATPVPTSTAALVAFVSFDSLPKAPRPSGRRPTPARGKTCMARKIARYVSWLGYKTQVYNVGSYRRARLGSHQSHSFFDPRNETGLAARREVALAALDDMIVFLGGGGDVAIYDAT